MSFYHFKNGPNSLILRREDTVLQPFRRFIYVGDIMEILVIVYLSLLGLVALNEFTDHWTKERLFDSRIVIAIESIAHHRLKY